MIEQRVESSNIDIAGHEGTTLYLQFKSGIVYSYTDVPLPLYEELVSAPSVGQFFHRNIRGKFDYKPEEVSPFTGDSRQGLDPRTTN
jgi:hypothetical protein